MWLTLTDPMFAPFCGSKGETLMFMPQKNDKLATTVNIDLRLGDVVQFKVRRIFLKYVLLLNMYYSLIMCHIKYVLFISMGHIYCVSEFLFLEVIQLEYFEKFIFFSGL